MKWSSDYLNALPASAFAYVAADGSRHLPYRTVEGKVSLPAVRDSLAQLGDLQLSDSDRTAVKDKLQGSLKASDTEDEVMTQVTPLSLQASDDGTTQLPTRMMLLRAGVFNTSKYGEVPLKPSDLKEMAVNFKAGIGMAGDGSTGLPVDFAHQSHLNAAAWIKDVAVENDDKELWATSLEWSGTGKKAILEKEYKMSSSDFYPAAFGEWVDAESGVRAKNVIVGAALTNRPMFTGNQPVVTASDAPNGERQITKYIIANEDKEPLMDINAIRVKAADDVTVQEQRFLQANASQLSADERKKFEVAEVTAAADDNKPKVVQASAVKGDEGLVAIQASELKGLTDTVEALKASDGVRVKASMEAEVDKHIARGAIKADRKDSWTSRLVAADDDGRKEILADLKALADNPVLAKEQGKGDADADADGGSSAREQIMAHAVDLMKKSAATKPISIIEATALAKEQHPELVEAASAEHRANLTASDDQFTKAGINRG